jgi:hypothetical protein
LNWSVFSPLSSCWLCRYGSQTVWPKEFESLSGTLMWKVTGVARNTSHILPKLSERCATSLSHRFNFTIPWS